MSVGGGRLLDRELGCEFLQERDQRASHDIVVYDVDQWVEKRVAVGHQHCHISGDVNLTRWSALCLHTTRKKTGLVGPF